MLEKVDIHLVDHCNLNCKSCTHFSPLAQEFYLNIDEFEKDMTQLSELTKGEIGTIFLLGGEPLLHKDISDFFPITRNLFRNSNIVVITNGILLTQKDDKFFKSLRYSDVQLWISKYDFNINYEQIEKRAKEFDIKIFYTSVAKDKNNKKTWWKFPLDIKGEQHWVNSFEKCSIKNCVTLKNGKLYTCPILAHIEHFNKHFNQNLEVSKYDYIDIYEIQDGKAILDAMVKPIPFCRYCNPDKFSTGYWEISKKEIEEWI